MVVVMVSSGVSKGTSKGFEAGEIDLARSLSLFSREGAKRGFSPWWRGVRKGLLEGLGLAGFLGNIYLNFWVINNFFYWKG